ncbi:MAG: hypothetical protein FWH19_00465 [Treponema sp.]|nr:hypothetical protein [Treponema sp.]
MITVKEEAKIQESKNTVECIHGDDCPLHSENPPFNAVTLAAMQEAEDMISGKKPCTWHNSPENFIEALKDEIEN